MSYLEGLRTLNGYTMTEMLNEMLRVLPPAAYTAVGDNKRFTDINPAYLTEVVTRVFGPIGIGWKFEYDDIQVQDKVEKTRNGDRTVHIADIFKLRLYYAFVDDQGNPQWSEPILATGGNKNSDRGHAVRGALTNAIGAAFAKLCWQLRTYKGIVTHDNAQEAYEKQKAKDAAKKAGSNGSKPERDVEESEEAPITTEAVEVGHSEGQAEEEPADERTEEEVVEKVETGEIPLALSEEVEIAMKAVIPDGLGIPRAGSTLGEIAGDKAYNERILTYITGERAHASTKEYFKAETPELKALRDAGIVVLAHLREQGKVTKARRKASA